MNFSGFLFRPYHLFRLWLEYKSWKRAGEPIPPPHPVKQYNLLKCATGYKIFIETGTYKGDMVNAMKSHFEEIHSIELADAFFNKAKERFKAYPHIHIHHGDSSRILPQILENIKQPAIFWLDGHYSGGATARGEKVTPILSELECISKRPYKDMILVDDVRLFNGKNDYPELGDMRAFLANAFPGAEAVIKDDGLIIAL